MAPGYHFVCGGAALLAPESMSPSGDASAEAVLQMTLVSSTGISVRDRSPGAEEGCRPVGQTFCAESSRQGARQPLRSTYGTGSRKDGSDGEHRRFRHRVRNPTRSQTRFAAVGCDLDRG